MMIIDGYTADQVRYVWSHGRIEALILHKIRLPDFQIKESFVTNRVESYATGGWTRCVAVVKGPIKSNVVSRS